MHKNKKVIKKEGYYTQGNAEVEMIYNNSLEEKYSLNNRRITDINHMPSMEQMPDIQQIPSIQQMADIYQIRSIDQKSPPLPVYDTKMPAIEKITAKK